MIKFHKITKNNLEKVLELDAGDKGKYIATNSYTISQASLNNHLDYVKAISFQVKNKRVFLGLFYFIPINKNKIYIKRFMIDKEYQNRGIGTQAFQKILKYLKKNWKVKKIELSTDNPKAKKFYGKFDFIKDNSKRAKNFYKKYKEDIMYLEIKKKIDL